MLRCYAAAAGGLIVKEQKIIKKLSKIRQKIIKYSKKAENILKNCHNKTVFEYIFWFIVYYDENAVSQARRG